MKKIIKNIWLFIFTLFLVVNVNAKTGEYFAIENSISSNNTINHNYYQMGDIVSSTDIVNGIHFMLGNSLHDSSFSEYSFIVGKNIDIKGNIQKDLYALGSNIIINDSAIIGRDAYLAGKVIEIGSNISGNAFIKCDELTINNATLNGDIKINVDKLVIGDNVKINGTLKYNDNASVSGLDNERINNLEVYKVDNKQNEITIPNNLIKIIKSCASLLLMLLIIIIFPKVYDKINKDISIKYIILSIIKGIGLVILIPIIFLLLLVTIIGIPLSLILLMLYILTLYLAKYFACIYFGNQIYTKLMHRESNKYIELLLGYLISILLSFIPLVGGFVNAIIFFMGVYIIFSLFRKIKE